MPCQHYLFIVWLEPKVEHVKFLHNLTFFICYNCQIMDTKERSKSRNMIQYTCLL
jgi:hypothetical protein